MSRTKVIIDGVIKKILTDCVKHFNVAGNVIFYEDISTRTFKEYLIK